MPLVPESEHQYLENVSGIPENRQSTYRVEEWHVTQTGIKMTADELLLLPDRGVRYELLAGEQPSGPLIVGSTGSFVGESLANWARSLICSRRWAVPCSRPEPASV